MSLKVQVDVNTTFTALLDVTDVSWVDFEHYDVVNYVGLDGVAHHCPAIRNDFINNSNYNKIEYQGMRYTYDPNLPTVKFYSYADDSIYPYHDRDTYILPNKVESIITYDIPAGTYTPSDFETLIKQFISNNRNRRVENAFQVNVNGQTVSVPANSYIYYTVNSSSPQGYVRAVWFNQSFAPGSGAAPKLAYCQEGTGFTLGHCYVVYIKTGSGYNYVRSFADYARYNIGVGTGIKFR